MDENQRVALEQDLERVALQEKNLVFGEFNEDTARELGNLIIQNASAYPDPVVIDIRRGDSLLFFASLPGTTAANADWARRKRNLVNLLETSSYAIGVKKKLGNDITAAMALDPRDFASHGGCFPIRVRGAGMIGTVTVSGLPQRDDHKLATDSIAEFLGIEQDGYGF